MKLCVNSAVKNSEKMLIKVRDHCHYTGNCRGASHFGFHLQYRENDYILINAYSSSWYGNQLTIMRITSWDHFMKTLKNTYFFSWGKDFAEENKGKVYKKCYFLRFIDSARLMKTSLDSLVDTLSDKKFSQNYKHWKKCQDFKECHECDNHAVDWWDKCEKSKRLHDYCKICNEVNESCKYLEVTNECFMFKCWV